MQVLPINNAQYNSNFKAKPPMETSSKKVMRTVSERKNTPKPGFLNRLALRFATYTMALISFFACTKNDIPVKENSMPKDHVDFAIRDLVGSFGVDTSGYTRVFRQAYALNDGDYTVDIFQEPTNADTMVSHGIYYYNGNVIGIPRENPYVATWTRTTYNGEPAVEVNYKYQWEVAKSPEMPEPQHAYYIPGTPGDNHTKLLITPGTGNYWANVDITGSTASYTVEDMNITNPYWIEIENYAPGEIQPIEQ